MSSPKKRATLHGDTGKPKTRVSNQQLAAPLIDKKKIPPGQWQLTDKELEEEVTCILYADKPKTAHPLVQFNHQERSFKPVARTDNEGVETHLSLESYVDFVDPGSSSAHGEAGVSGSSQLQHPAREHNYFNFTDRAAQTAINSSKDRCFLTDAIETRDFAGSVNQWIIFDAYENERLQKERSAKERDRAKLGGLVSSDGPSRPQTAAAASDTGEPSMLEVTLPKFKILERMVNQPIFDDVNFDFRYWQTPMLAVESEDLVPLPLWKFQCSGLIVRQPVTTLCWSPAYSDLLAVGYGSFEHLSNQGGKVACFSLKNPSNAEYAFDTEASVTSIDFNKQHPHLLAVGLCNGKVLVFDMRVPRQGPMCKADIGKEISDPHSTAQVRWHPKDTLTGEPRLYTVSTNGIIQLWTMSRNGLTEEHAITLLHTTDSHGRPSTTATTTTQASQGTTESASKSSLNDASRHAMTCCIDLRPQNNRIFVVGTEEGSIIRCDRGYNSHQLGTIQAHHLSVHAVHYNLKCPTIFASAGADWHVRIWKEAHDEPLRTFDLGSPVGDVAWSPTRPCIFAAVTSSGKLAIFDLANKADRPVMEQQIVKRQQLTRLAFSPTTAVLLVGDGKGCVYSVKLPDHLYCAGPGIDSEKESQLLLKILREELANVSSSRVMNRGQKMMKFDFMVARETTPSLPDREPTTMSSLEEEAQKRKERLQAMKARIGSAATPSSTEVPAPAADAPTDQSNRKRAASPSAGEMETEAAVTLEQEVEAFAKDALEKDASKKAEVDLADLAPRKPNWDLKRDLEQKLAKLERRTDLAIAQLIRQRLKEEGNTDDNSALESAEKMERDAEEED